MCSSGPACSGSDLGGGAAEHGGPSGPALLPLPDCGDGTERGTQAASCSQVRERAGKERKSEENIMVYHWYYYVSD